MCILKRKKIRIAIHSLPEQVLLTPADSYLLIRCLDRHRLLASVNGVGAVPTWVVLDSSTGSLKFTAQFTWTKTQFSFKVSSFVHEDSVTVLNVVNLTVEANPMWLVANCDKWLIDNPNYWSSCSSRYSKYLPTLRKHISLGWLTSSDISCQQSATSSSVQTAQIMAYSSIGVGFAFWAGASAFGLSSLSSIWAVFAQLRLLMFLILTHVYLPKDVVDYITGNKVFLLQFFVPVAWSNPANQTAVR